MHGPWVSPIEAAEAIRHGSGRNIRIAVLDSGVEWSHPALARARRGDDIILRQEDGQLMIDDGTGNDVFGHGTAVAGILHDLAPEAELGSFRVLDESNRARSEIICEGARLALDRGYDILNCSFGARLRHQVLMFKEWTDRAYLERRHVVAACNNDDFRRPEWPGDFTSVITVNMSGDVPADAVLLNRAGSLVEFTALGVNVKLPWRGGQWVVSTGSSFAAPRVTALLARLLSVHPTLPPWEAKVLLMRTARAIERSGADPSAAPAGDDGAKA
jgi:subtilisin family serine protease